MAVQDGSIGERPRASAADMAFAHLFAQAQRRRGLKGGASVLAEARSTYLGVEYSGDADRRLPPGILVRTRV